LTESFTNLYKHGQRLNTLCKKFFTEFKKAEEEGNDDMMIIWAEALRKTTVNCVSVAMTVLGVEELLKGKNIAR